MFFLSLAAAACGSGPTPTASASPVRQEELSPTPAADTPAPAPISPPVVAPPPPAATSTPPAQAEEVRGLQLVADNRAAAANAPELAAVPVRIPNGLPGALGQYQVNLPPGFSISLLAAGLQAPRFMRFDDAGNLLVADAAAGTVYRYTANGAGTVDPAARPPAPLLRGLDAPSNVAFWGGYLYVGETRAIVRYRYDPAGGVGAREVVVPNLPSGGHNTRTVAFGPDGTMYVAVGSSCNICAESDERRATILRFNPDGGGYQRFAWGLRNAVGLAIQPGTGLLWATVNESDNEGNETPTDLVTIVRAGENFGWPGCVPPNAEPRGAGRDCSGVTPPTVGIQAHSAPLGLEFSTSQSLPADYANSLFVAQHGSWNRTPPAPPKLLRMVFDAARPVQVRDFATGWQNPDGSRWGRTAGIITAPDGSLIVSDDDAGVLYRIWYAGAGG